MIQKYKKIGLAAVVCTLLGINALEAAVTLTFQQVGSDVTATWSGTYDLPTGGVDLTNAVGAYVDGEHAYGFAGGVYSQYAGSGAHSLSNLVSLMADGYVGDTFGYNRGSLIAPMGANGVYAPEGTMTFENTTLSAMGAASLNNFLAFTGAGSINGSREIRLQTVAVPEPSRITLVAFGGLIALLRRRW
jgi:hypothetical protein